MNCSMRALNSASGWNACDVDRDHEMAAVALLRGLVRAVHRGQKAAARQHAGEHVHHRGDGVALVLRHRQDDAVDRFLRVGGRLARRVDRPAERDRQALVAREVDLAARDAGGCHVHHERRALPDRRRDRPRIGADDLLHAAPRRHRRPAVGGENMDAAFARAAARVVHAGAEVVGHAHADRADAVRLGALRSLRAWRAPSARGRRRRGRRSRAIAPASTTNSGFVTGFITRADAVEVPAEAQHAVRLVAPQVRLHQRVGDEARIGLGHAGAGVDGGGEVDEAVASMR